MPISGPSSNNSITQAEINEEKFQLSKRLVQAVIDSVVIVVLFIIYAFVFYLDKPKIRYFTCDQSDIFFPYKDDTVPYWSVALYGTLGPLIFIILIELSNAKLLPYQKNPRYLSGHERRRKFFVCLFHGTSLFILGMSINVLLTDIGKKWIGRLRPHFMDVCAPDFKNINCTIEAKTGYVYRPVNTGPPFCTGNPKLVEEARLSFPSGHASFSSYTMVFLIVYVEARLFLLKFRYIKPLVQVAAFIAAYVTSTSRISDYHHRGSDVIGGAFLGTTIALAITYLVGRVLWDYEVEKPYADFDLKPRETIRQS